MLIHVSLVLNWFRQLRHLLPDITTLFFLKTYSAFSFIFFPSVFYIHLCAEKRAWLFKKVKACTDRNTHHFKHRSRNASTVDSLLICDVTLRLCLAVSLACKNLFSTDALLFVSGAGLGISELTTQRRRGGQELKQSVSGRQGIQYCSPGHNEKTDVFFKH